MSLHRAGVAVVFCFASLHSSIQVFGQPSTAPLDALFIIPDGVETRWFSPENVNGEKGVGGEKNGGRKGASHFPLKAGKSKVLAEVSGRSGAVRRFWVTINERTPEMLRGIKIEMFWDGADKPAVSAPLGDFFGHGLGRMATFQNALFSSPEGRSFNCYIPMPFKSGMKVVVTNETHSNLSMFFFDIDCTLGDKLPENTAYFHAHFRRENPTQLQKDYEILPKVAGRGRYLGANIGVIPNTGRWSRAWWGEGEVKIYLDGDTKLPTLCGTGTEDYIGTGWGQGQYANLFQGCTIADDKLFQFCFYRLHVPDPVYFQKDARVTMQQIGYAAAHHSVELSKQTEPTYHAGPGLKAIDFSKEKFADLFERQDDWSSCAYFYMDRPTDDLPALPPLDQRIAGLNAGKQ